MAIHFEPGYLRTIPGMLLVAEIVVSFIVLICCGATWYPPEGSGWIYFVGVTALIISCAWLAIYILNIPETVTNLPWILAGLATSGTYVIFYFIAGCVAAAKSSAWSNVINANTHSAYGAAAFFSFLAMIAFGLNFYFWLQDYRNEGATDNPPPYSATTGTHQSVVPPAAGLGSPGRDKPTSQDPMDPPY